MIIILGSQMQTSFILVISFVFCLHGLLMNLRGNFRGQSNYWIILLIAYLRVVAAKKKSSIRNETMETKNVWYQTATVASTKIICVCRLIPLAGHPRFPYKRLLSTFRWTSVFWEQWAMSVSVQCDWASMWLLYWPILLESKWPGMCAMSVQ